MIDEMRRYVCHNLNGSQTGSGTATSHPNGWWCATSFGSPWGGQVCDDGRRAVQYGVADPDAWMASYGLEPEADYQERASADYDAAEDARREWRAMHA